MFEFICENCGRSTPLLPSVKVFVCGCKNGRGSISFNPNLLTIKQQERKERIKQSAAHTQRLISWLAFFRLPGEIGVGDTAHRLNMPSCKSTDANALLKRLLTMCSCSRADAVAKLNKDYPYK